jgi:endonuclease/exonuclease/phosphatase family metal-dependent hydrolase
MRHTLLVFALLTSIGLSAQNFEELSFGTDSTLDIITWNVENFPKNENTTINDLSQAIEALDADIIAFQEITDTTEFINLIDGMPQYEYYIGDLYYIALALIYKPETIENADINEIYTSYTYWNAFPRSPLVIEFTYMGQDYSVINNHLKCCGEGNLDMDNEDNNEFRRYSACNYLKTFIDQTMRDIPVVVLGDMNDELDDITSNNVFQMFIDDEDNYRFDDMDIALGDDSNWSYPSYPSHLDHILITNELFNIADHAASVTEVIKVDELFSNWDAYYSNISDHRPMGIKLYTETCLSVENTTPETLNIFPNPAVNQIHITNDLEILEIQIFSSDGRLILSETPNKRSFILNISELDSGSYILKATNQTGNITRRLIKL